MCLYLNLKTRLRPNSHQMVTVLWCRIYSIRQEDVSTLFPGSSPAPPQERRVGDDLWNESFSQNISITLLKISLKLTNIEAAIGGKSSRERFWKNSFQYQLTAMKYIYQLRGMARTLRMRTTISPGQWQPWTAASPLLGLISMV